MKNLLVDWTKNYTFLKVLLAISGPISTIWLIYVSMLLVEDTYTEAFVWLTGFVVFEFLTTILWWRCFDISKKNTGREE